MTPLHQINLPTIIVCAVIVFVALALIQRWALQRLNSEPADDLDSATGDKDAEILGDVPVRSKVGTPRARRLQPPGASEEPALSPAGGSLMPGDSLAAAGAMAFAKPTTSETTPGTNQPKPFGAEGAPASPFAAKAAEKPADKPVEKPADKVADKPADKPRESVALPPLSVGLTTPPASSVGPTVEKVADGIVAIGQPVPLAASPTPTVETDDDVKKRKSSSASTGSKPGTPPGLVIIPKSGVVTAETVKPVEIPVAPAAPPPAAAPVPEPKPEPTAKITGRPRIFLPANLPAASSTAKPVEEPAPATAKTEVKPETKPETPAVVIPLVAETKPEVKADLKPEAAKPEEKPVAAPVALVTEPAPVKMETPVTEPAPVKAETPAIPIPAPVVEPAKPEAASGGWLRGLLRRADSEEPAKPQPSESVAAKPEEKPITPAIAPVPVAETKPVAPAPEKLPEPRVTMPKISTEPALASALVAETKPAVPAEPPPAVKPAPAVEPSPVAKTPAVPISSPQPTMAQNDTTTNVPADARASAQLTLGFEVASLQLTPFFKLGGVQLKPLSKVVGLHLVASQSADNPLAAGISFEIEKVEVNEASHIKSILLKPLGESKDAAVPQSNLKVDTIQIGQGGTEGAPISVTSSGAAVQLLATFAIAAMEFTPAFEIGSLRLEPTSNSVLLRLSASGKPASLDLPPAFEVANVQLGEDAQITLMRLTPGSKAA